jgi:hypothetical protein
MRPELSLEHLERVDSDVCVALSDVEVDALELLSHLGFLSCFFFRTRGDRSSRRVIRFYDAEVNFLKISR